MLTTHVRSFTDTHQQQKPQVTQHARPQPGLTKASSVWLRPSHYEQASLLRSASYNVMCTSLFKTMPQAVLKDCPVFLSATGLPERVRVVLVDEVQCCCWRGPC